MNARNTADAEREGEEELAVAATLAFARSVTVVSPRQAKGRAW